MEGIRAQHDLGKGGRNLKQGMYFAATSPRVSTPFSKFKVNPCKHPIVIMKDVGHKELVSILEFMYRGEVNVRQEELASFLKTAESLQVKGLTGDDPGKEKVWLPTQRFETNKKLMDGVNNWLGNLVVLFLDKGLQQ
ncbi:unnamed protein product [Timema podura]|uniref:BTB domain-containing protein n=1 Tax=Timema podura TaxID=61482 RepID=A0ABN7NAJ9_TIMPD|nr:unnamed protein product [Timema podura]